MRSHHREAVAEALAVALFGDAAHEVVSRDEAGVHGFAAFFQDLDTPVVVGAEVVFDERRRDGEARDKSLVNYKHSAEKLAPVEVLRQFTGAEFTHCAGGSAPLVHEHGFAIEYVGFGRDERSHFFQNVGRMDVVAAVEAPHEVAGGDAESLVHGIVQPFIWLGDPADVGHSRGEFLYDLQRVVFGSAVHEDILDKRVGVSLPPNAFHGAGQVGFAVIDDGDDGENGRGWTVDGGRILFVQGAMAFLNERQMYSGMIFRFEDRIIIPAYIQAAFINSNDVRIQPSN